MELETALGERGKPMLQQAAQNAGKAHELEMPGDAENRRPGANL